MLPGVETTSCSFNSPVTYPRRLGLQEISLRRNPHLPSKKPFHELGSFDAALNLCPVGGRQLMAICWQ